MTITKRIEEWKTGPYDAKTKAEIRQLEKENPQALADAFFTDLSFGTGGLRGVMGVGTNRMNIYTVRRATQGLAEYIKKQGSPAAGVFIGFDSRHHSREFAEEAARVLAANQIKVYLLQEMRPTPFISFGCRAQKCQAAVMITASHNPKEYNGYKVYWSDGAQIVPPHDTGILEEIEKIQDLARIPLAPLTDPHIHRIGNELDAPYLRAIAPLQNYPQENKLQGHGLKITYSSLHGTGITLMPAALKEWGFTNVNYVKKQIIADGDFPTVAFPNPEYPETLSLGIETMKQEGSDIFITTDPDADRLAVVVSGKVPTILNGNQMASIATYYLCDTLIKHHRMPAKGAFVTTIVTTELLKVITESYHKPCFEVLTGFKYIGEKIHEWETGQGDYQFVFGAEESYGFLLGTHARDKDAIVAGCLMAEIALYLKLRGRNLVDYLQEIYAKYGVFLEKQFSLEFSVGQEGLRAIAAKMKELRKNPPQELCGKKVIFFRDFEKKASDGLPLSDVLLFRLEDSSKVVIRPSGTEPKIKIYSAVRNEKRADVAASLAECKSRLDLITQTLKEELRKTSV